MSIFIRMKKIIAKIKKYKFYQTVLKKLQRVNSLSKKKPLTSLFITLVLLLIVIAINSFLRKPEAVTEITETVKKVSIYSVGQTPRVNLSARVEESNVIDIFAQTGGVVQRVLVEPGQKVFAGQQLYSFSTDYYGSSAPSLQRQLAQVQYDNVTETYDTQVALINDQRTVADLQKDNADEMKRISQSSVDDTKGLLELNESLLSGIDLAISVATDSAEITSLKSQKAQLLAGINQIKSGLRQAEYQADEDKPPYELQQSSYEMTRKQLDLQEKSLAMSKEISGLQLKLAKVQESLMYPGTPVAGVIERIYLEKGKMVSPGIKLATIKANHGTSKLVVTISRELSEKLNKLEATHVVIDGAQVELYPDYVSTVPTDGKLYSAIYTLPSQYQNKLANGSLVSISIPVGTIDTNSIIPFLPLEAIYQSELENTIFVLKDGVVESLVVELGIVNGNYVEIKSDLGVDLQVILDRNVIEGQLVEAK